MIKAQWVARPTQSIYVVSYNHTNTSRSLLDKKGLPSLLVIIWIQERILK